MSESKINTRFGILVAIIVLAAASRFISPFNFSPIGAISLFGAAYFTRKSWAFIVPFVAMWVSDLILNNVIYSAYYEGFTWFANPFVYVGFALTVLIGFGLLKKVSLPTVAISALAGTIVFFLVTNFGSWLAMPQLYSRDITGLTAAYAAGVPFLQNSLIGNLLYSGLLFGVFEWMKASNPRLVKV